MKANVILLPPLLPARNIMCIGKNYIDHVAEFQNASSTAPVELPKHPIFFSKATNTVIGIHFILIYTHIHCNL